MAGFLYIVMKDEAKSFAVLKSLIQKNDMSELFNTENPKLKLFFYTLDRLISIY